MRKRSKLLCALLAAAMIAGDCSGVYAAEEVTQTTDQSGLTPANPVYDADTDYTDWSYVYFGMYPQTEATEDDYLDSAVENASYNENGDAIVENHKFRRVKFEDGSYHYYVYEPIKWRVLQNDGEELFLVSDVGLEQRKRGEWEKLKWKTGDIRSWLNGYNESENALHSSYEKKGENFISIAFSVEEQDALQMSTTNIDNIKTKDNICLLTGEDCLNNLYGFATEDQQYYSSYTRKFKGSNYANRKVEEEISKAWLASENSIYVNDGEVCDKYEHYTTEDTFGYICPALHVSCDTDKWSLTEPDNTVTGISLDNATVKLSRTSYEYDGKAKTPKVTVKNGTEDLVENIDYTVEYADNTEGGTATVTVKGTGDYIGSASTTFEITKIGQQIAVEKNITKAYGDKKFKLGATRKVGDGKLSYDSDNDKVASVDKYGNVTINGCGVTTLTITAAETANYSEEVTGVTITVRPKKQAVTKLTSTKKGKLTVKWTKDTKATGYEIQCAYGSSKKKVNVKKASTTTLTISGLKPGKKYKVTVRAYKTASGKKIYGEYSKARTVTIKK